MISQCYKGNRHLKLLAAHEKYGTISPLTPRYPLSLPAFPLPFPLLTKPIQKGNIVRMAPNVLSFNTIPALQAIHTDRSANVNRDEWYKSLDISQGAYSTQSCMDKTEHAFRRRVVQQAFSERALRDQEGFVLNNVETFCDRMGKDGGKVSEKGEWSGNVNLGNWATWFSFDFISDISLGRSFGLLADEEKRYVPSCLMWTSQFLYYVRFLFHFPPPFPPPSFPSYHQD
jgi:cytochrome P450